MDVNWTALVVFIVFFGFITWLGFVAARWRKGDLDLLQEWGLAGSRFGTLITWFLIGGDVYTAYTFIAVPALAFGAGAIAFFAVPYAALIYPVLFLFFPRLWSVCRRHGYVTAADFARGRFGNRYLALAVAVTGLVATMPYIALQLVGLQVVIAAMGVGSTGWLGDLPLIIAFVILAAFTYSSGLRAPAAIAIVKDMMIYIAVFAAVIVVPIELGGFGKIFAAIPPAKALLAQPKPGNFGSYSVYSTLALGSALALFLYPHSVTGILSSTSRHVVRRNAALLPAYTIMLGLLALLGFFAIASGIDKMPQYAALFAHYKNNFAVPGLILYAFPAWFAGFVFAAIGIGALVPAAIMSIAAANIWTRNVHHEFIRAHKSPQAEARIAKLASLVVKLGALFFIIFLPQKYAINLQLLGGVWIIQTLPTVILGLYTRWLNGWALLIGWAVGILSGTWIFATHGIVYPLVIAGTVIPGYAALYTLVLNIVVSVVLSAIFNPLAASPGADETSAPDYI